MLQSGKLYSEKILITVRYSNWEKYKKSDNKELQSRALQILRKTCYSSQESSKKDGCFYTARIFDYNDDYHSAEKFYKQACYELGKYYAEGEVVRYKPKEAEKYLGIACDSNVKEACQLLKKFKIEQNK